MRQARVSDAPACARIVLGWVQETEWIEERFSEAELTDMISAAIPVRKLYVAGDPVAGYLSFDEGASMIVGLYTSTRGAGLGKALVDHVKPGRDNVQLWTHAPNARAHAFYEREGFVRTGATRDGDDGLLEFQMAWTRGGAGS